MTGDEKIDFFAPKIYNRNHINYLQFKLIDIRKKKKQFINCRTKKSTFSASQGRHTRAQRGYTKSEALEGITCGSIEECMYQCSRSRNKVSSLRKY